MNRLGPDSNWNLLVPRQLATVRDVLVGAALAGRVGWVVQPVRS